MKPIIFLTISSLLLFFSCRKDSSSIGLDIQPASDKVSAHILSYSNILAYTFTEDSISTDERSYALLGSYNDPIFGKSVSSFISQVRLASFSVNYGTTPVADSICIFLDYTSYYGDTTMPQTIEVYRLNSSVYPDSVYYSNFDASSIIESTPLTTFTFTPQISDTALMIKLPITLAQELIDAQSTVYKDNTQFLDFFKGLYFKPILSSTGGAIVYFNLLSTRSKLILYYTNSEGAKNFSFAFNTNCARINMFSHDYSTSTITGINDSLSAQQNLYLQGNAGLGARIYFPGLATWKDSGTVIVSKAELVIPIATETVENNYPTVSKLLLVKIKSGLSYDFVPDYLVSDTYFGGTFNASANEYRFNIGRYIQQIIDGTITDNGLALISGENRVNASRTVVKNANQANGLRIEMYYFKP